MGRDEILARVLDPDDRVVVMTAERWDHIMQKHPYLGLSVFEVMEIVEFPDHRTPDPLRDRERYYGRGVGPSRWVRVVVAFDRVEVGKVLTAFPQHKELDLEWQ